MGGRPVQPDRGEGGAGPADRADRPGRQEQALGAAEGPRRRGLGHPAEGDTARGQATTEARRNGQQVEPATSGSAARAQPWSFLRVPPGASGVAMVPVVSSDMLGVLVTVSR